jgi:CRISPR-associated protein Csh2
MTVRTGELLFVKCVKDGIPNRDPLRESDARRLFGPEDGRISLSDVSIKRDVRDYVLAKYPEGGTEKNNFVFVRKEFKEGGEVLLGREGLANILLKRAGRDKDKDIEAALMASAFDMRAFGAVFSVKKKSFSQVGPVQFGWAHSLHPVETKYVQGTVVMPSEDAKVTESGKEEGASQGTIWTAYQLPFAVFAMPGVVNASIAKDTTMTATDVETLLEGLWKGTLHRQARGRGLQQPLLLLHVEYADQFFRIGYLEEGLRLDPGRDQSGRNKWLGGAPPTNLGEVSLDVTKLSQTLRDNSKHIARARMWVDPKLRLVGDLPAVRTAWAAEAGEAG